MKTLVDFVKHISHHRGDSILYKSNYRVHHTSYTELVKNARTFATYLHNNGIKKGDSVLLWATNSPEWVVTFFGCVFSGVIVVPIDYAQRSEVVKKIQEETQARLLVCSPAHVGKLKIKTLNIEKLNEEITSLKQKEIVHAHPSDIAQIVYTSGTTGVPKGVVLTHENIISNLLALRETVNIPRNQTFLCALPLSHLLGQMGGLFFPLLMGERVMYLQLVSSQSLVNALQREEVTALVIVPRILQAMYDRILWSAQQQKRLTALKTLHFIAQHSPDVVKKTLLRAVHKELGGHLRYIIIGGAFLDPHLEQWWDDTGITVIQGYGLTETSPVVSFNPLNAKVVGSVGVPLKNVEVKIASDGEILVRGPNVFSGYYKDAEKTKSSFTDGYYKTGDIGHFKAEYLYLKGRKKDVIATAEGLKVYPEDVEQVLEGIPGVKACAVVGYPRYDERVHAFLILKPGVEARNIIAEANKHLASSQQIQEHTLWPESDFPRTTTLKVKKFELLRYLEEKKEDRHSEKTDDPLLRIIGEVTHSSMKKLLPNARLSQDLKLSSLDRVELIARIEQELHVDIDEGSVGADTTIKDLQEIVKTKATSRVRKQRRWTRTLPIQLLRNIVQPLLYFGMRSIAWVHVEGKENLRGVTSPVCIVSNHTSHLDTPALLMSLPYSLRKNIAVAMYAEYFEKYKSPIGRIYSWLAYQFTTVFFNVFLLPQKSGFRSAFEYAGELIDHRWNVMIFPEGERTKTGRMNAFKPGIGLLASALDVPIIPVKIEGLFEIYPRTGFKRPGSVTVRIGKPFRITKTKTLEITKEIEEAVKKL